MNTLNFVTKAQRRNVINMPSQERRSKPFIIHCRQVGCRFKSSARTEGSAVRSLCTHIVTTHQPSTGGNEAA